MADYPKAMYKPHAEDKAAKAEKPVPSYDTLVVAGEADKERALAQGWHESPADFGVETAPGVELQLEPAKEKTSGKHAKDEEAKEQEGKKGAWK